MGKRVVVALGGNAILQPGQTATFENQYKNVWTSCETMVDIAAAGHELVITHGNGPQVGNILRQNELAKSEVPSLPMPICSAESQGFIGYMMEQALKNILAEKNMKQPVVALLTETEVDPADKAFEVPTKPIGSFYTKAEADQLTAEKGWIMGEDAGRGYRRLVASPMPMKIHGVEAMKKLLAEKMVVISTGGGGIPVMKDEAGKLSGVDAVIDKDRSALQLAKETESDTFMILTDVSNVYLHYGQPDQKKLETITVSEAEGYAAAGHFSDGSMGPKMEACIAFAKTGKEAIICALDDAVDALAGKAGTRVVPD